jgi:adenylylsulfate kinase
MSVCGTPRLRRGATVWLTGLPGAGKSTIATTVATMLSDGVATEVLDGDELRATISSELGFSAEDRDIHVRRVGFIAELLASHRILALVPVIAPLAEARSAVREHHRRHGTDFLEVYVATPVAECARRDPKGLYARAFAGELNGLTGVDDDYEQPVTPDLLLDTTDIDAETAAARVLHLLADRRLLDGVPTET